MFRLAVVLISFVSWLRFLFVVDYLLPKSVFMASVRVGRRFWLFGVLAGYVLAIAKK